MRCDGLLRRYEGAMLETVAGEQEVCGSRLEVCGCMLERFNGAKESSCHKGLVKEGAATRQCSMTPCLTARAIS